MKRINKLIQTIETEWALVNTPEEKRKIMEDAKLLAPKLLNGVWLELALIAINALEATIK